MRDRHTNFNFGIYNESRVATRIAGDLPNMETPKIHRAHHA